MLRMELPIKNKTGRPRSRFMNVVLEDMKVLCVFPTLAARLQM